MMMALKRNAFTRRGVLKGLALSSFGLAVPAGTASRGVDGAPAGFAAPAELLTKLVKMRGSLDGRLVFIWLRGLRYTLVNGEAAPLCSYLGGSITRYRRLADDMFEFLLYEVSYYTDIETGEVLETLRMPYTDKDVSVPLYRTGPGRHVIMMANEEELDWSKERTTTEELAKQIAPDAKVFYRLNVRPAVTFGGRVWIRNDSFTRLVPNDPAQPGMFYKEAITYQADRADLEKPGAAQVDATLSFAIATAWRPWMQMAGVDGHTVTDGVGGKVLDILEMPGDFVRFTKRHHPDVLDDPAALLES
jgi:hypothetical protein